MKKMKDGKLPVTKIAAAIYCERPARKQSSSASRARCSSASAPPPAKKSNPARNPCLPGTLRQSAGGVALQPRLRRRPRLAPAARTDRRKAGCGREIKLLHFTPAYDCLNHVRLVVVSTRKIHPVCDFTSQHKIQEIPSCRFYSVTISLRHVSTSSRSHPRQSAPKKRETTVSAN